MEWIHELRNADSGAQLNIGVDFQKLLLEIEFLPLDDEEASNELGGSFSCSSLEELCLTYSSKMKLVSGNDFKNDIGGDEGPINLRILHRLSTKCIKAKRAQTKDETFARQCLKDILIRRKEDSAVHNLVFHWNDDYCEGVHLNNTRLNGISEAKARKHIEQPDWLDGEFVEPPCLLLPGRGGKPSTLEDCQSYMDKICALLEAKRCFGLVPVPENFRAFSVWNDD